MKMEKMKGFAFRPLHLPLLKILIKTNTIIKNLNNIFYFLREGKGLELKNFYKQLINII